MQLSTHFWLTEFVRSSTAARRGIDNTPVGDALLNLDRLANEVLEPIRREVCKAKGHDVALHITSGYRCPELNTAIGGSVHSDHMRGRAADVIAIGVPLNEFAEIAKAACESLPVRQCIREFGEWVHVSIEPYGRVPRREYLTASLISGITLYAPWA
jgi:zinc D-Ala-D-Ala carboxypeptidase